MNSQSEPSQSTVIGQNSVSQQQLRQLVAKINALVESSESQLQKEKESRHLELDALTRKQDAANANQRREQDDIHNRLQSAQSTIKSWRDVLQKQQETADAHLNLQLIKPDGGLHLGTDAAPKPLNMVLDDPDRFWQFIADHLGQSETALKRLQSSQKPAYLAGILGIFGVIGFIGGVALAVVSRSVWVYLFVQIFQLLLGVGVVLIVRNLTSEKIQKLYGAWKQDKDAAEGYLVEYQSLLQRISEKEIAESRKNHQNIHNQVNSDWASISAKHDEALTFLIAEQRTKALAAQHECEQLFRATTFSGADWDSEIWKGWEPFTARNGGAQNPGVRFGDLTLRASGLDDAFSFRLPAMMSMANGRGLLVKVPGPEKHRAVNLIQAVMFRMLSTMAPGMVRFTLFDPVGLGQNVAAFMPLGIHDERLITSKAWSEPEKIEEELSKLTDHLTDVIQSRLRNDHLNIEDYNEKTPALPEPYRVVVGMDFPVNFRTDSARRLVSIAQNGARCGFYPLIVVDSDSLEKHTPHGFNIASLEPHLDVVEWTNGQWTWRGFEKWAFRPASLGLSDQKQLIDHVIASVGTRAKDEMTVVVKFEEVLNLANLGTEQYWTGSTLKNVEVPLGQIGNNETQKLVFGGAAHHGIIIGRTGSGKSKLMDVIITTLALKYSPDEIQFYLIDLKSGVGFKPYATAKLPHARVIAIDSEREYALSVLRELESQMDSRHESFRAVSKENLSDYRSADESRTMPRILLVVDEFQNLFLEDDAIGRDAGRILERLTREGRSAGIHILLGSQSLAGKAANLPNAALGQIGIRIALMCNASDAQAIMAHDNAEARLLSRPGEAIYNDHNGLIEGNKRFQVALLTDEDQKKYLNVIADKADGRIREQLIFEGNQMARLEECKPFGSLLRGEAKEDRKVQAWLGEPISIREPISVRFRRQSGNNLLVVAHDEGEGVGMLASAWLSLAAQHDPDSADFYALNYTNVEEKWHDLVEELGSMLPHHVEVFGRNGLPAVLQHLCEESHIRSDGAKGDRKSKYLLIFGMQRAKDLRPDDGARTSIFDQGEKKPSSAELFSKLVRDGAENGIHIVAWCDMANNVKRTLSRNLINEFNYRVATRMSQDDSQFVVEGTAASKLDRAHRAVFYDEDRPGLLEKFRPFAVPDDKSWLEEITRGLSSHHSRGHAG